tara:strand:+ start:2265 stop:2540 length:276 start_codon:yes stop_codon:yes gene_type:complete
MKSPINKLQQLMVITMEECGELTQRCSKIMRRYDDVEQIEPDQRNKLLEEAGDVLCMLELMEDHGLFTWADLQERVEVKENKLKKWSTLFT